MTLDIGTFLDRSRGVDTSEVDWAYVARVGVTDAEARCLRYMSDVENHAVLYLPDVLAGRAAHEYELRAFLATWAYEETQHGRALDRFLEGAGRPRLAGVGSSEARVERRGTFGELIESLGSRALARATPHFVAVHMAWGAASEMTAALAYTELAARTKNRELAKLLGRLAKDERRHQAFYYQQAQRRLRDSSVARTLTRVVLEGLWGPVGDGVADPEAFGFIGVLMFDDAAGRDALRAADRTMARLPGLDGFTRISAQVAKSILAYKRSVPRGAKNGIYCQG